ncbi:MAG: lipoyl(octanoyl) transferase [Planctomycetaceae bacterium]|nr:lipoyl(octanoyl) transferase [Planctomycetaceae bacterium]
MSEHFTNQAGAPLPSKSLEVHLMGLVDFDSAVELQERLVYEISGRRDTQGALLVCEHPPVATVGREGSRTHLPADLGEFAAREMELRRLNRGGGCVVHAPGQLAVYPIVSLARLDLGLSEYRYRLEEAVIRTCAEMRVSAYRREDEGGLWCRSGQFATLGVAVRSWVAYHGLFINVSPLMELVRLVRTTTRGERITSLAAQRVRPTSMN